jgi:EAL domain-containing protein (putative c-di-GMP-specific phosphodiesterase class I)
VKFLDGVDADQVQGYFFGRPIPSADLGAGILTDFRNSLAANAAKSGPVPGPRIVKSAAE